MSQQYPYHFSAVFVSLVGLFCGLLSGCSGGDSTVAKTPGDFSKDNMSSSESILDSSRSSSDTVSRSSAISLPESTPTSLIPVTPSQNHDVISTTSPQPGNVPQAQSCQVNLAAPAIMQAVLSLPPDSRSKQPWNPEPIAGNYNECADLSAVIIKANTNSSHPATRALLFHAGQYLTNTTADTYGFDGIVLNQSTSNTVTLRNSSGIARLSGIVKFRWNGHSVDIITNAKKKKPARPIRPVPAPLPSSAPAPEESPNE